MRLNYPWGSQCSRGTLLGLFPASTVPTTNLLSPLHKHLAHLAAHSAWGTYFPVQTLAWLTALVLSIRQALFMPALTWASILDSGSLAMASWVSIQPLNPLLQRGMPTPICCPTGCPVGHLAGYKLSSSSINYCLRRTSEERSHAKIK